MRGGRSRLSVRNAAGSRHRHPHARYDRTMKGFAALVVLAALSASTQTQPPAPAATATSDGFPEGAGKAVVLKVCSNCHGYDTTKDTKGNQIQMFRDFVRSRLTS